MEVYLLEGPEKDHILKLKSILLPHCLNHSAHNDKYEGSLGLCHVLLAFELKTVICIFDVWLHTHIIQRPYIVHRISKWLISQSNCTTSFRILYISITFHIKFYRGVERSPICVCLYSILFRFSWPNNFFFSVRLRAASVVVGPVWLVSRTHQLLQANVIFISAVRSLSSLPGVPLHFNI